MILRAKPWVFAVICWSGDSRTQMGWHCQGLDGDVCEFGGHFVRRRIDVPDNDWYGGSSKEPVAFKFDNCILQNVVCFG
jgi:hypothetical protein